MRTEVRIPFCAKPCESQPTRSRLGGRSRHGHPIASLTALLPCVFRQPWLTVTFGLSSRHRNLGAVHRVSGHDHGSRQRSWRNAHGVPTGAHRRGVFAHPSPSLSRRAP
jgi:hypothetical protein